MGALVSEGQHHFIATHCQYYKITEKALKLMRYVHYILNIKLTMT